MLQSALHRAKIEEAKRLIRRGRHNFSEIAGMLCCNDPHCFSRVFRRLTNMSPNEYRATVSCNSLFGILFKPSCSAICRRGCASDPR